MTCFDLKLINAVLREGNKPDNDDPTENYLLFQIGIKDGKIVDIALQLDGDAEQIIDCEGGLVTEAFCNTHMHLDKVFTLPYFRNLSSMNAYITNEAEKSILLAAEVQKAYEPSWIHHNATIGLNMAVYHGCLFVRAFADVTSYCDLIAVKTLAAIREEWAGIVTVQVVAFPQNGLIRDPKSKDLLREAMEYADVVGGIPWMETTDAEMQEHVDFCFELAVETGKPVSMLVDDAGDPGLRTTEMMASAAIKHGLQGRVLAHHARAMELYPQPYFQKMSTLLKEAQMGVVTNPHTGPLHANVSGLMNNGNLVIIGQDDLSDAYYPHGKHSMLGVAYLAAHLLWLNGPDFNDTLYDMITVNPAISLELEDYKLQVGGNANIIVHESSNMEEVFRWHESPRYVISNGVLLDSAKYKKEAMKTPILPEQVSE
eukprot:TRINITY_DN10721_c0_g1_i1.p1 TRINITY_DN10721_c0_g1~~TRINITY_DN10721_c0_g1_i1.p1  ORF type:complete len:436 (-),score=108.76 TRINITY_DN10721_c0_g1_i1:42-1325(-)